MAVVTLRHEKLLHFDDFISMKGIFRFLLALLCDMK